MDTNDRNHTEALFIHSGAVLLLAASLFLPENFIPVSAVVLPVWGAVFFTVFYIRGQHRKPLPPADYVTWFRLLLGLAIYGLAAFDRLGPLTALALALTLEFADGLDGWLARRIGPTPFGGIWDMESDAFIILMLAFAAVRFEGAPVWMLLAGAIRYLFFFPFVLLQPPNASFPVLLSWFSKTVCVASVFCLTSVWYLPGASLVAVGIVTVLLIISFLWETAFYISLRIQARRR